MHQCEQSLSKGNVRDRVQTTQQRELKRRNIRLRVHQFQGDE